MVKLTRWFMIMGQTPLEHVKKYLRILCRELKSLSELSYLNE